MTRRNHTLNRPCAQSLSCTLTHGNDIARTTSGTKVGNMLRAGTWSMELKGGVPDVVDGLNFRNTTPSSLLSMTSALTSIDSLVNGRGAIPRVSLLKVVLSVQAQVPERTLIPVPIGIWKKRDGGRTTSDILRPETSRNSISVMNPALPGRTTRMLTSSSSFSASIPVERKTLIEGFGDSKYPGTEYEIVAKLCI